MDLRCDILNAMFQATDEEIKRFEDINTTLNEIPRQLKGTYNRLYFSIVKKAEDSWVGVTEEADMEGTIHYSFNGPESVLKLEDDDFYGSHFQRMIEITDELMHEGWLEIYSITDFNHLHDPLLDKSVSWAEPGPLDNPKLHHICICYATHDIITHKNIPIVDFLRMNNYSNDITITYSDTCDQKGNYRLA